jgi:hypothetical protein
MRWPWNRNRELEQAKKDLQEAERRGEDLKPLARNLGKHDRSNHFAARFRAAGLGGRGV